MYFSKRPRPRDQINKKRFGQFGKGQMGSALMGSLQISCCLTEGLFGTPVNLQTSC